MIEDGPVGVVLADGRIDFEPAGQLYEELDVLLLVQPSVELALHFRVVHKVLKGQVVGENTKAVGGKLDILWRQGIATSSPPIFVVYT